MIWGGEERGDGGREKKEVVVEKWRRMARPYLRRLMEEGGETANLYLEQDGEAICMVQIECRQMMRAIARPGGRVKMHCSGAGKVILGW